MRCVKYKTVYKRGGYAPCSCHVTLKTMTEALVETTAVPSGAVKIKVKDNSSNEHTLNSRK
jgi:hypothetical protein